jgi:hypothetical protein
VSVTVVPIKQAGELMNTFLARAVGVLLVLASSVVLAQTGHMTDGGGMGWGYGGLWGAVLLGGLVVAVVVLLMNRNKK